MPDLLFELFSEEIPARMQTRAAEDLKKLVTERLVDAGLVYEGATAFVTPRRLALAVQGIPVRQPDLKEEKKGPRVGAPDAAVQGFLEERRPLLARRGDDPEGPEEGRLLCRADREARAPRDRRARRNPADRHPHLSVAEVDALGRAFRKARRALLGAAAAFDHRDLRAGDRSAGHRAVRGRRHRSLATSPAATASWRRSSFHVKHFDDYAEKLEKAKVVLDPARRREIILADAKNLAFAQGYELVADEGLLEEVAGLVEWPVVLMGSFEEEFLAIPPEVIRTTIRNNQKCFVVRKGEGLANRFVLVSNIEATDGGAAIVHGNERVIRARLSDAKFFYETDLKTPLEARLPKFKDIVFHEKLGTQADRIERIERLAVELAPLVGADVEKTKRAARLAKADLLTEMVGEFPELQGLMGKYYARAQGEDESVAAACEDHYKPLGPLRSRADRSGVGRGRAGGQDRHARRFLGDRREADGQQGPIRAAACGAGGDQNSGLEQINLSCVT